MAYEYGIIFGYGNDKFGPMDKIAREQAMTMIARAMKITGQQVESETGEADKLLAAFDNSNKAAGWARESIASCINAEIVSGRSGKLIEPKEKTTQAEVAVIVRRLLQKSGLI
ncbi:MAG: S-layer homology domain-containing protein [Dysgonamonadaceae bacterium]|nr:S-layer homology domain-containing protein [Dysgonamonadaceae bacterium]